MRKLKMHLINEEIQFFKNLYDVNTNQIITLGHLFNIIKSNSHFNRVKEVRSSTNYLKARENLPLVDVRCTYLPNQGRTTDGRRKYNGLIFLDFDDVENPTQIKTLLIELPFVFAAWRSTSGKGVHGLAYSSLIKDDETYVKCWHQLYTYFQSIGLNLCENSKNITQLTFISSDGNILINQNVQSFFFKIEDKQKNEVKKELKNQVYTLLDLDFYVDKFNSYYVKKYIINKESNQPILYDNNIQYDESVHYLVDHLTEEQLSNLKNNSNTMCYFKEPISTIKINLYPKLIFKDGSRKRTIKAIIANYLFISNKK